MTVIQAPAPAPSEAEASRKRQRSMSSTSTGGSSPKRAASEDPSLTQLNHTLLTTSNDEIEDYLHSQGEDTTSNQTISLASQPQLNGGTNPPPSPEAKFATISDLRKTPLRRGETWYLVSRKWYRNWEAACSGVLDKESGPQDESTIQPVNNSDLVDGNGKLRLGLMEGIEIEYIPAAAWRLFEEWYGKSSSPLPRQVIPTGITKTLVIEAYPLEFSVSRLSAVSSQSTEPAPTITYSRSSTVKELLEGIRKSHSVTGSSRVWRISPSDLDDGGAPPYFYPVDTVRENGIPVNPDTAATTTLEEALFEGSVFVLETMQGTKWTMDTVPNGHTVGTQASQHSPAPIFGAGNDFFARFQTSANGSSSTSTAVTRPSTSLQPSAEIMSRGSALMTRSKGAPNKVAGTVGLSNMGNTCFMNSALQCLAHLKELTEYFIHDVYREELNPTNPLGMGGAIAEAFGALLDRLWTSPISTYAPREFKQQLQRFAPQFSGYAQHDSQELLAFLLDGLHEDLNRVIKKPYVENPDWEGGGEKEQVELAQKTWEGYKKRNDSVIVDLFQGQYKSTLVCPECEKVSITFDPFMYLTLPLPVQKKWRHEVFFVPWDISKDHCKVPVETSGTASMKDLKNLLGRWLDVIPENLLAAEVYGNKFYKYFDDHTPVTDVGEKDILVIFELPCPSGQTHSNKQKPNDDSIIIPIFHRAIPMPRSYSINPVFGYPFIVALTPDQASREESVYEAIVERYSRFTRNRRELYVWEGVPHQAEPSDGSETVTEIRENGEVVETPAEPEEQDIADMKKQGDDEVMEDVVSTEPTEPLRPQDDLFRMLIFKPSNPYDRKLETGWSLEPHSHRVTSFADRRRYFELKFAPAESEDGMAIDSTPRQPLIGFGDSILCEWDNNMRNHFFPAPDRHSSEPDISLWDTWTTFTHPEYAEAQKASAAKRKKGITIDDCLDEFTKEEKLGEEDLWYCPRCKKHQQATKKFELWKLPDVLVVHLKRFSSSRILRDKIDAFVDFPIEGLDLEERVGERQVANSLKEAGVDIAALGLDRVEEPLVYDLFAVDEHMGGLGGGHYRAYAKNHVDDQWYHFDDSHVTLARATEAVNPNAYLLFYRRRTTQPIGGTTHEKVRKAVKDGPRPAETSITEYTNHSSNGVTARDGPRTLTPAREERLLPSPISTPELGPLTAPDYDVPIGPSPFDVPGPSSAQNLSEDPPPFEETDNQHASFFNTGMDNELQFSFPGSPGGYERNVNHASPSSSIEAVPDLDQDEDSFDHVGPDDTDWNQTTLQSANFDDDQPWQQGSGQASPPSSTGVVTDTQDDDNPFQDPHNNGWTTIDNVEDTPGDR